MVSEEPCCSSLSQRYTAFANGAGFPQSFSPFLANSPNKLFAQTSLLSREAKATQWIFPTRQSGKMRRGWEFAQEFCLAAGFFGNRHFGPGVALAMKRCLRETALAARFSILQARLCPSKHYYR
jgi:hypothetical protein